MLCDGNPVMQPTAELANTKRLPKNAASMAAMRHINCLAKINGPLAASKLV